MPFDPYMQTEKHAVSVPAVTQVSPAESEVYNL